MIRSLAWRSITSRKLRAFLNGLGVVLGVALIFSVVSLSKTIDSTFDNLFGSVYGDTDIIVSGADPSTTISEGLLAKVKSTKGVESVSTTVSSVVTLMRDGKAGSKMSDQINVAGIVPSEPDFSGSKLIEGEDLKGGDEIQVNKGFADANNLKLGQEIKVATQSGIKTFKLTGIIQFGDGLDFGGQGFGAILQDRAREIFNTPSGFNEIDIKTTDDANPLVVQKQIEAAVGRGITVDTPNQKSEQITQDIGGFTIILYFFAGMALFAGGYLILNSFNMTVAQRLREIGMLRTLGGSRKLITRMILWEALFVGLLGSAIGIALGFLLTQGMIGLVKSVGFPLGDIEYPIAAFIAAPIVGLLATLVGALRPAIKAGRIPPIQAVLAEHGTVKLRLGRRLTIGTVLVLLGLAGVFTLASSSTAPAPVVIAGVGGIIFLLTGVIMVGPVVVPWLVRVLSWPLRKLRPIEGRLASDSARVNPVRTASTASGLMIGIALVAAIGTLGASFIGTASDDLDKEIKTDLTVQPKNFAPGQGPQQSISPKIIDQIQALPAAKLASGVRVLYVPDDEKLGGFLAYSYDPATHLNFNNPVYKDATVEEATRKVDAGQITIPASLAESKKLDVGDTIELSGPRGTKQVKIAALTTSNSTEASSVAMSNKTFDAIFGVPGYSQVTVLAASPAQREALGKQVNKLISVKYPTLEALSNQQIKQQIKDQINQVFSIFYAIMAVAILVSLLGVINTLLMNVLERTREIGVLRAIGSSRMQIRSVVAQESLLLTASGAIMGLVVGMALGYAFVRGISSGSTHADFHAPIGVIVGVAVLAVIFGLLASILPARHAARMNVIEAVSYE